MSQRSGSVPVSDRPHRAPAPGGPRAGVPMVEGLPGLDPAWSRRVEVIDGDGIPRTWHLLERSADPDPGRAFSDHGRHPPADPGLGRTVGTMLCLHGNPTWSYLWRRFLEAAPPGWRVIAPDQLGMGWSERLDRPRALAQRIDDLGRLTDALQVTGPVVTVAHDWGGPVLLGWAERHLDQLAGMVLTNTGVAVPAHSAPPALIRLARSAPLLDLACLRTPAFVRGATALSRLTPSRSTPSGSAPPRPALPAEIRSAFASPYAIAARRRAVRDFVADIPLEPAHPSRPALEAVVAGLDNLTGVPALLVWGPRDPVFSIRYLHDLRRRLPRADVQLYPWASHLVTEDAPEAATDVWDWVLAAAAPDDRSPGKSIHGRLLPVVGAQPDRKIHPWPASTGASPATHPENPSTEGFSGRALPAEADDDRPLWSRPLWAGLLDRAHDPATAIAELGTDAADPISFADLETRVADLAAGLLRAGVRPGQRVAVLVRPGIDLTVAVYACWRAGASIVVADAGLGLRNLGRALRSADPDHVVAIPAAMVAARALRVPGQRILAGALPRALRHALQVAHSLAEVERDGHAARHADETSAAAPPAPDPDAEAAVLFTSGATGPAKGVVYRHRQLRAQLELVAAVCQLEPGASLVAAFAPFALYGPALGAAAAVPDMDVTKPGTLTATALAEAVAALDATAVFASPAALRNVAATAPDLTADLRRRLGGVRVMLSAGAPVPISLLRDVQALLPGAELHTPYGMTEALPVTDVTLAEVERADSDAGQSANGVCVGRPLPGVRVAIDPLDSHGRPSGSLGEPIDVTGEICVTAAHVKDHYDRLWVTQRRTATPRGWHRTGDVGHLDGRGRLWVEGRLVHVITGPDGPVTPVGIEQRAEALPGVVMAAAVGVGPAGTQQTVVVVVPTEPSGRGPGRGPLAAPGLTAAVRATSDARVAAVLVTDRLPVDIRHASKIDRSRVARWADHVLAGGRVSGRYRRP